MTSNQITQLWETHAVPAMPVIVCPLNRHTALLLTINTREGSDAVNLYPYSQFSVWENKRSNSINKACYMQNFLKDLSQEPWGSGGSGDAWGLKGALSFAWLQAMLQPMENLPLHQMLQWCLGSMGSWPQKTSKGRSTILCIQVTEFIQYTKEVI